MLPSEFSGNHAGALRLQQSRGVSQARAAVVLQSRGHLRARYPVTRMILMQMQEMTLADRLGRQIRGSRSRTYWLTVLVMAAIGAAVMVFWPAQPERPLLSRPAMPRPDFRVTKVADISGRRVERLNLTVLSRPGVPNETLQAALNWALYSILEEYNLQRKHRVRVIWAYAVEDSTTPLSHWRAMAIWADPKLPQSLQPAHSGGDAVQVGSVEYDFTNPLLF
jgi:hypothetical protein